MGMSTHITGFIPADEKWHAMKKIFDECVRLDIEAPDEVWTFFGGEDPGDKPGQEAAIGDSCKDWRGDCSEGYEIEIDKIPPNIKFIRFYNSW